MRDAIQPSGLLPSVLLALVNCFSPSLKIRDSYSSVIPDELRHESSEISQYNLCRFFLDKHRITIAKEAIVIVYRMLISIHGIFVTGKRTHQHNQG